MNLKPLIDAINTATANVAPGISIYGYTLVSSSIQINATRVNPSRIAITSPRLPFMEVSITPDAGMVWDIVSGIVSGNLITIGGQSIDFHGQFPEVERHPEMGVLRLRWSIPPRVDLKIVPKLLDPEIDSVVIHPDKLVIEGQGGWRREIKL